MDERAFRLKTYFKYYIYIFLFLYFRMFRMLINYSNMKYDLRDVERTYYYFIDQKKKKKVLLYMRLIKIFLIYFLIIFLFKAFSLRYNYQLINEFVE